MTKIPNSKPAYDIEERTFQSAKAIRLFVTILLKIPLQRDKYREWQTGSKGFRFSNTGKIRIVLVIRFWNLILGIWDFKDSVNGYFFIDRL
jgi:hypothetical protein